MEFNTTESTVSLLHDNKVIKTKRRRSCKISKKRRVTCYVATTLLSGAVLLSLVAFIWIADITQGVRCGVSETLSLGAAECVSVDVLKSLSERTSVVPPVNNVVAPDKNSTISHSRRNNNATGTKTSPTEVKHSTGVQTNPTEAKHFSKQDQEYITTAESAWDTAWAVLHDDNGWKLSQGKNLDTGIVYTKSYKGMGTVTKVQGYVDASPEDVFRILVTETDQLLSWNPSMKQCKIVYKVSEDTDILYVETNPTAGGIISAREFVNLRHWKSRDGITLSSEVATTHPDTPPSKHIIRVVQKPGGALMRPVKGHPNKCLLEKTLSADIGGWIPQWVVDDQLATQMMEFLQNVRDRARKTSSAQ